MFGYRFIYILFLLFVGGYSFGNGLNTHLSKMTLSTANMDTSLIVGYEYWFDRHNNRIYVDVNDAELVTIDDEINTDDLSVGIHAIHFRFLDSKGKWSSTTNKFFVKTPQSPTGIKEIVGFEYWFDRDNNRIYVSQNHASNIDLDSVIEASQLPNDIHSLHIRFVDNAGVWSSVYSKFFMKTPNVSGGVKEIVSFEYWFDRQTTRIPVLVQSNADLSLDSFVNIADLENGIHSFHIRYLDNANIWSSVMSKFVMKTPNHTSGLKELILFEYWFDRQTSRNTVQVSNATDLSLDSFLNTAQLEDGIHSIHLRYLDNANVWSSIYSKFFMKTPNNSSNIKEIVQLEYWFDRSPERVLIDLTADNLFVIDSVINTTELSDGIHYIRIRYKDNGGVWSSVFSKCFYKSPSNASGNKEIVAMEYWFDRNTTRTLITLVGDSLVNIDSAINFSTVTQGNHNLYIRYLDNGGVWSSVINKRVIKVLAKEVDSNQIYLLRYWFDQASSNKIEIYFNPKQLIDLDTIINTVSISKGTHKIHYQYLDTAGIWSVVKTDTFVRVSTPIPLFSVNDTDGCVGASFSFTNNSIDANAYMWYFGDGDSSAQANPSHSYTNPGRYTVTLVAKDVNLSKKHSLIKTGLIHVFARPTVTIYKNNLFCYADKSGSINFNISGSYAPYKLSFNGGGYDTTKVFSNLVAGTYYSYIKDSNGCVSSYVTQITQPTILKSTFNLVHLKCNGDSTGEITIQSSGGTTGYRYSIDSGSYQSSNIFSQLKAGTYAIHIRDSNDCAIDSNFTLVQPSKLNYTYTVNSISCFGDSTGRINIVASGGVGGYQFKKNNGAYQDSSIFRKLVAGNYTITMKDSNQCVTSFNTSIAQPAKLTIVKSITAPGPTLQMCYGDSTAVKTIQVIGGVSPYLYKLNNQAYNSSATFSSLKAGIYYTTVKDSNGCIDTGSFVIHQAPKIVVASSVQTPSCYGDSNAVIQLVANYGYAPYSYQFQNSKQFNTNGKFDHLKAGSYIFYTMDVNGCRSIDTVHLTQPNVLIMTTTIRHIDCKGDSSGSITLNAFGGTAPYSYRLGNAAFGNQNQWTQLKAGQYTVYIQDANACLTSTQITISEPSLSLSYTASTSYSNCSGNSGVILVNASGGTPPYQYQLGNGSFQSSNSFSQLTPGTYQITLKDSLGCIYQSNVLMPVNNKLLSMTYDQVNICCDGSNTGEIKLYASGGNTPYLYNIDNGVYQTSNQFVNISKGTHTFTLKDSNTCTLTISVSFTEPSQMNPTIIWTGLVDSSWNNKLNWSPQRLPTSTDSVKIPAGLILYPTVSTSQSTHSIRIDANAYIRLVVTGRLNIYGVVSKAGSIYASGGLMNFYSNTGIPQGDYVSLGVYGQAKMCGDIKLSNSLNINTTSSLDNRGYHLYANGTINNLGSFKGDGSLILQKNNGYQTVQGVGSYSNLEVNTPSNYGARIVNDALVTDSLKLKNGTLILGENITLTIGQTNSSKGYILNLNSVISSGNSKPSNLTIRGNAQASMIPNLNLQILGTLTISRPAGISLGNSSIAYGLDLQTGVLDMNGKNLVLGNNNSNLGINTNGTITNRLSSGLLQIYGQSSAPLIDMLKMDTIYAVNFSRPAGIKLGKSFWVRNLASINKGYVDLNGHIVNLSSTASIVEQANGVKFKGDDGAITTTRNFGTGINNLNVAGMGLKISTTQSLSNTTLTRGHKVWQKSTGKSIRRYFQLRSDNYQGAQATLEFMYDSTELQAGSKHQQLLMNVSLDLGNNWLTKRNISRSAVSAISSFSILNFSLDSNIILTASDSLVSPLYPSLVGEYVNQGYVFPNPTQGKVTLVFDRHSTEYELSIYDINGKRILHQAHLTNQAMIDLNESFESGVYVFDVFDGIVHKQYKVCKLNN